MLICCSEGGWPIQTILACVGLANAVITCQDGAPLAREQIQVEDKEHVLSALGTAAASMRGKLGESLNSIQKPNRPPEQATTASLEALQNYTAGHRG
jgi:hypothetical protein